MSSLIELGAQGVFWPPLPQYLTTGPAYATTLVVNSTDSKAAVLGNFWHPSRNIGPYNITRVHFRFGTVSHTHGTNLVVSLQNPHSSLGPPGRPDETQDQSFTINHTDSHFASNTWFSGTLNASRSIYYNEPLAAVWEADASGVQSTDSAQISIINNLGVISSNNDLTNFCVIKNASTGAWSGVLGYPVIVLECDDGSFGFLGRTGMPAVSTINTTTNINSGTSPNEIALRFSAPFNTTFDGCYVLDDPINSSSDFDIVLYQGTTTVLSSLHVSAAKSVAINTAHYSFYPMPEASISSGTVYYLAIRPSTTNNVQLSSWAVLNPQFWTLEETINSYGATRQGYTSTWTETPFTRYRIHASFSAFSDGITVQPGNNWLFSGTINGVGNLSADLLVNHSLVGEIDGTGIVVEGPVQFFTVAHLLVGEIDSIGAILEGPGKFFTVNHSLIEEIDGIGLLLGDVPINHPYLSSCAGLATLSASLAVAYALQSEVDGISTLDSIYTPNRQGNGNIDGSGSLGASLPINHSLIGSISGIGSIIGDTFAANGGTVGGQGNVGGNLNVTHPLQSEIDGLGTVLEGPVHFFTVNHTLIDRVDGLGTIVGDVPVNHPYQSSCAGTGTIGASLTVNHPLSSEIDGVGTLAGSYNGAMADQGSIGGSSSIGGNLNVNHPLQSEIDSVGTLAGNVNTGQNGQINGSGSVGASLGINHSLQGEIDGIGTVTGNLNVQHTLQSEIDGIGQITGNYNGSITGTGSINGTGSLAANLSVAHSLNGEIDGIGTLIGGYGKAPEQYAGEADGVGTLSADLHINRGLTGEIDGNGGMTAGFHSVIVAGGIGGVGIITGNLTAGPQVPAKVLIINKTNSFVLGHRTLTLYPQKILKIVLDKRTLVIYPSKTDLYVVT